MLSAWDIPKIDAVMEHGYPDDSDRTAWSRIKKELAELAQQSNNSDMLSTSQINIALKAMEYDEHRISFISECMAGICEHCGQVTDKCYCMCDD